MKFSSGCDQLNISDPCLEQICLCISFHNPVAMAKFHFSLKISYFPYIYCSEKDFRHKCSNSALYLKSTAVRMLKLFVGEYSNPESCIAKLAVLQPSFFQSSLYEKTALVSFG
jgi:hypothetical protein